MTAKSAILVSICLCTYKRAHLRRTLESLNALDVPDSVAVEIVVADNDPDGSGKPVIEDMRKQMRFLIHYEIEPRKGISHARNRTLTMANGVWLAFIDDDETVDPGWLRSHLGTAERLQADVLVGLVNPRFEPAAPAWVSRSGLYEHERQMGETGEPARVACTSNAFMRAAPVREMGLTFDPAYGLSGAEDNDFFRRLGLPVLCNREAVVWETLPPERATLASFERRAVSFAKAQARIRSQAERPWRLIPFIASSLFKACAGALLTAIFYPLDIARSRFYHVVTVKNFAKLDYLFRRRLEDLYG